MIDRPRPRPHKSIEGIYRDAQRGASFLVDQAVLNGDLSQLSEQEQRMIVAVAHDNCAAYACNQVIPTTAEKSQEISDFINRHIDISVDVFFRADGKSLQEEIEEFRK